MASANHSASQKISLKPCVSNHCIPDEKFKILPWLSCTDWSRLTIKNGDCVATKVIIRSEMKYERFDFLDSLIPISFNRSAEIELEIMFKLKIKFLSKLKKF